MKEKMEKQPKEKCCEMVRGEGSFGAFHMHQCSRNAVAVEDGKPYCKQHMPSREKARRDYDNALYELQKAVRKARDSERKAQNAVILFVTALDSREDVNRNADTLLALGAKLNAEIKAVLEAESAVTRHYATKPT